MKTLYPNSLVVLFSLMFCISGCSDQDEVLPFASRDSHRPNLIEPGEMIQTNLAVRVTASGTYLLASGATLLTTSCSGMVTVSFDAPNGVSHSNNCHSTQGSSNQTNVVTGVYQVYYQVEPGAFADVTLR